MPTEVVSVGINGFGLGGRSVFYAALQDPNVSVVAINTVAFSTTCLAYMMRQECPSHMPRIDVEVTSDKTLLVNGLHRINVTQEARPSCWGQFGVQVVLECTGTNTTRERCISHITFGAQRVVVGAHSADAPVAPLILSGVDSTVGGSSEPAEPVSSCGSHVGAVLAPLLASVDAALGLTEVCYTAVGGFADEVESATGRSGDPKEWRQVRLMQAAAGEGGVFAPSDFHAGAATLGKLFPHLKACIGATAIELPGHRGCAVDLVVHTTKATTPEIFEGLLQSEASTADGRRTYLRVVDAVGTGPLLSSDCIGCDNLMYEKGSATYRCGGHSIKLTLWVDLEWAYAKRMISVAKSHASMLNTV